MSYLLINPIVRWNIKTSHMVIDCHSLPLAVAAVFQVQILLHLVAPVHTGIDGIFRISRSLALINHHRESLERVICFTLDYRLVELWYDLYPVSGIKLDRLLL